MHPSVSLRVILTLACLLSSGPALSASLPPLTPALLGAARPAAAERALRLLEDGDFEGAVDTLQRGLNQQDLSDDELAEMYRVLGLAQLYLGREEEARESYEKLLQAQPDYELPEYEAPKIRALYARIKDDIKKRRVRPVTLSLEVPEATEGGGPVLVVANVKDLALGSKPRLYYRRAGRQSFNSVDFTRDQQDRERFTAQIPSYELPIPDTRYEVEYYVEVADAAQRRLAGRGDALQPLVLNVLPRGGTQEVAATPFFQTPWPYVIGGVVVAGVVAGIALANQQPQTGVVRIGVVVQ